MDVIHSFWVPNLAGKQDLIPGRLNQLTFTASRPGRYRGQCAEFCGLQHAHMAMLVVADEPHEFERWRERQIATAPAAATPEQDRGRQVFTEKACAACHAIRGTPAAGTLGPDLTHVAGREYIGAGVMPTTRGSLAAWIADPQGDQAREQHAAGATERGGAAVRLRLPGVAAMTDPRVLRDTRDTQIAPALLDRQLARIWGTPEGFWGMLTTVDHKRVGRRYIATAFVFLAFGGVLAMAMRLQLSRPEAALHRAGPLQPDLHHARREHDVPVRRAGDGGHGRLPRPADGRHAEHRLPTPERILLLDLPRRRHPALGGVRDGHGAGRRLVRLRPALRPAIRRRQALRHLGADDHLHRSLRAGRRGRARRHHLQAARARHVARPHPAVLSGRCWSPRSA